MRNNDFSAVPPKAQFPFKPSNLASFKQSFSHYFFLSLFHNHFDRVGLNALIPSSKTKRSRWDSSVALRKREKKLSPMMSLFTTKICKDSWINDNRIVFHGHQAHCSFITKKLGLIPSTCIQFHSTFPLIKLNDMVDKNISEVW